MGRTVVVEECLKSDLEQLVAKQQFQIGILIGQLTQSKDYVTLVIRTPTLQEISKEDASSENSTSTDHFEEWWVVEHARQMCALLPGGLNVIGVFVCCSNEQFKNVQIRVLKLLKDLQQCSQSRRKESLNHSILLHCSTNTKRHSCQTTVPTDPQSGYRPAELKYQSHRDQWHCLESCLSLNTQCHIECAEGVSVQELVKSGLQSIVDEIWSGVVTVRGKVVKDENELLVKPKKGQQQQQRPHIKIGWLLKKPFLSLVPLASTSKTRKLHLHGNMSLLAYVHSKATYGEAISAMKQDAERSLLARVVALCESVTENDRDTDFSHCQLPCRLAVLLPKNPQHITEYKFQEEDVQDALTRVCELTGLSAASLATRQLEQVAKVTMETSEEDRQKEEEVQNDNVVKRYSAVLSIVATVTVALLAVTIWLVMNTS